MNMIVMIMVARRPFVLWDTEDGRAARDLTPPAPPGLPTNPACLVHALHCCACPGLPLADYLEPGWTGFALQASPPPTTPPVHPYRTTEHAFSPPRPYAYVGLCCTVDRLFSGRDCCGSFSQDVLAFFRSQQIPDALAFHPTAPEHDSRSPTPR